MRNPSRRLPDCTSILFFVTVVAGACAIAACATVGSSSAGSTETERPRPAPAHADADSDFEGATPDEGTPPAPEADSPEVWIPCPEVTYPPRDRSPYVLPYPEGHAHNVRQGNCNPRNTHNERYNATYAYDFEMPIGSPIVAVRAGRVLALTERFENSQRGIREANFVAIAHDDRTYAMYGHLTKDGVHVEVGDRVEQGRHIADSGNSGLSRGPHLHFAVKACPEGSTIGSPDCTTIPVTFRNTRLHPHGLIGDPASAIGGGEVYLAGPLGGGP